MAVDYEVESLDGIAEGLRSEYEKTDSGKYRLKVNGIEDVSGLKANRDKILEEKKAIEKKAADALAELEQLRIKAAGGGSPELAKMYEDKINELKTSSAQRESELLGKIGQITAGETAVKIASDLARTVKGADGNDYSTVDLLKELIGKRVRTEFRDGNPVVVVLDKSGNPTANSIEDLKNEIKNNPSYSPLITGSKASGAGDQAGGPGGGTDKDIMKLSPVERMNAARAAKNK